MYVHILYIIDVLYACKYAVNRRTIILIKIYIIYIVCVQV